MAITTISKVFEGAKAGILNVAKSLLPVNIGVPQSIINSENIKYMVSIQTRNPTMNLTAFLQDKFSFNVTSDWTDSGSMSGLHAALSDAVQLVTGASLVNTMATRRKWRGSSPISLTMKLKFEAFENVKNEVIAPCAKLQSLVLPSGGYDIGLGEGEKFALNPPGPNPFYLEKYKDVGPGGTAPFKEGQVTSVTIGNFLTFSSVIVSSVDVVFESRMGTDGPIGAEVTVVFQTYEMLTKDRLDAAYHGVLVETTENPAKPADTAAVPT